MKLLFLAALSLAFPAHGAEQRIECPARYPAQDIALPETGEWVTGLVPARIPLAGAGMFVGPLARRGELRGGEQRIKGGVETRFGFEREQNPPEKWFVCHYGEIQLARRVADTTTACTLTHERKKFPAEPRVWVSCK